MTLIINLIASGVLVAVGFLVWFIFRDKEEQLTDDTGKPIRDDKNEILPPLIKRNRGKMIILETSIFCAIYYTLMSAFAPEQLYIMDDRIVLGMVLTFIAYGLPLIFLLGVVIGVVAYNKEFKNWLIVQPDRNKGVIWLNILDTYIDNDQNLRVATTNIFEAVNNRNPITKMSECHDNNLWDVLLGDHQVKPVFAKDVYVYDSYKTKELRINQYLRGGGTMFLELLKSKNPSEVTKIFTLMSLNEEQGNELLEMERKYTRLKARYKQDLLVHGWAFASTLFNDLLEHGNIDLAEEERKIEHMKDKSLEEVET
ncbi:MAG: hypothetical protein U9R03_04705 [Candidatus Aerophobetes bacterium]|nr:hypothetical protein [Candidatus Aerophobetes bacterium]